MISILPKFLPRSEQQKASQMERELMRFESQLGRHIFGPIPKNHHRDFFCLDEHTWIWHEDWIDEKGHKKVVSTKYTLRPEGVIKSLNGQSYHKIDDVEADHLYHAIKKYISLVRNEYYQRLQA